MVQLHLWSEALLPSALSLLIREVSATLILMIKVLQKKTNKLLRNYLFLT